MKSRSLGLTQAIIRVRLKNKEAKQKIITYMSVAIEHTVTEQCVCTYVHTYSETSVIQQIYNQTILWGSSNQTIL